MFLWMSAPAVLESWKKALTEIEIGPLYAQSFMLSESIFQSQNVFF